MWNINALATTPKKGIFFLFTNKVKANIHKLNASSCLFEPVIPSIEQNKSKSVD